MEERYFDKEKAKEQFSTKYTNMAKKIVGDKDKLFDVINRAFSKTTRITGRSMTDLFHDFKAVLRMAAAWGKGQYKEVPVGTIVAIIAAALYLLSPIDLIPDFIPVIGYMDDAFILGFVLKMISSDLEKFRAWEQGNKLMEL